MNSNITKPQEYTVGNMHKLFEEATRAGVKIPKKDAAALEDHLTRIAHVESVRVATMNNTSEAAIAEALATGGGSPLEIIAAILSGQAIKPTSVHGITNRSKKIIGRSLVAGLSQGDHWITDVCRAPLEAHVATMTSLVPETLDIQPAQHPAQRNAFQSADFLLKLPRFAAAWQSYHAIKALVVALRGYGLIPSSDRLEPLDYFWQGDAAVAGSTTSLGRDPFGDTVVRQSAVLASFRSLFRAEDVTHWAWAHQNGMRPGLYTANEALELLGLDEADDGSSEADDQDSAAA